MKDINRLESSRETQFKDAVLNAAEMRGMEIIAKAQRASVKTLQDAQEACRQADEASVWAAMARDTKRQENALTQAARQELLRYRAQVVDALFARVQDEVSAFVQGEGYAAWLAQKLSRRAGSFAKNTKLTVWLRPQDMGLQKAAQEALPGAKVLPDAGIRLGGAKVAGGRVLHNDTLDEALRAEREAFAKSGVLGL